MRLGLASLLLFEWGPLFLVVCPLVQRERVLQEAEVRGGSLSLKAVLAGPRQGKEAQRCDPHEGLLL
jgi:hypothetical protein